jgi:Na+/melibiose symporter-like transporter
MPTIGNAQTWSQFGIGGLVIFALFVILIFVVYFTVKRFDKIDERNVDNAKNMAEYHRQERAEWRNESSKQTDKFEAAITRLADGIRDSRDM